MARGKLSQRAQDLAKHRQAVVLSIDNADQAFGDLEAKVTAIEQQRIADPISPRLAVATMKRYLSEDRYRIQLEDFVIRELTSIRKQLSLERFPLGSPTPDAKTYTARVEQFEVISSKLVPMVATAVYWGGSDLDKLWRRCLETLLKSEFRAGMSYKPWSMLQYYPAALLTYGAGLTALLRNRLDLIRLLLLTPFKFQDHEEPRSPIHVTKSGHCLQKDAALWLDPLSPNEQRKTPGSDWMVKRLPAMLVEIIGDDVNFEDLFDDFECLISLVSVDAGWPGAMGRFGWRHWHHSDASPPIKRLIHELSAQGEKHPLLQAGFFRGGVKRFAEALRIVSEHANQLAW